MFNLISIDHLYIYSSTIWWNNPSKMGLVSYIYDWCGTANGLPYTYNSNDTTNRIFYIFGIFGAMLYSIIISTHFQLFMTWPNFQRQFHSVRKIIEQDFILAGDSFALEYFYKQNEVRIFILDIYVASGHLKIYIEYIRMSLFSISRFW